MPPAVPHELPLADGGATRTDQPARSPRTTLAIGAVVALLIVGVAWFVGGR
jgi:hypothetical protein